MRKVEGSIDELQRQLAMKKNLLSNGKSVRGSRHPKKTHFHEEKEENPESESTEEEQKEESSSSSSSSSSRRGEGHEQHPNRYYIGCFQDGNDRDIPDLQKLFLVDPVKCMSKCATSGYKIAGLQAGNECWCGKSVGKHGTSNSCTKHCSGNPAYTCGGDYANDVYFACKNNPDSSHSDIAS